MFEAFFLAALVVVVVLAIRGNKVIVLDNPVIIQRVGCYHATLAPQLAHAQNFIGQIAGLWIEAGNESRDLATQYFEIHDANMSVAGHYLLAVALRAGILYFQAILPVAGNHHAAIREFSGQVMLHHPLLVSEDRPGASSLHAVVEAAAMQLQITCHCM